MGRGHRHPWPPIGFDVFNKGEAYGRASGSGKVFKNIEGVLVDFMVRPKLLIMSMGKIHI